jgi:hypothetical protein
MRAVEGANGDGKTATLTKNTTTMTIGRADPARHSQNPAHRPAIGIVNTTENMTAQAHAHHPYRQKNSIISDAEVTP